MQTTARTSEETLRKWHLVPVSTCAARLGGVGRIDFDELSASLFRFARQLGKERRPGRVRNAFGQAMVVHHAVDDEILNTDESKLVHDVARMLMGEVLPLPLRALMHPCHDLPLVVSLTGSFLHFGELTLRFCQRFLFFAEETGVLNLLPI